MKHAVASLLAVMACVDSQEYNYNQQGVDWSTGTPPYATCVAGGDYNNQSPIDIKSTTSEAFFGIQFNYSGVYRDYTVAQDTHDLVITPNKAATTDADSHVSLAIQGVDVQRIFNLVNYVIKTKAEHTLDGVRNDMEVQVRFQNTVDANSQLVLSFIYKSSTTANADTYPGLKAISEITPAITGGTAFTTVTPTASVNMFENLIKQTTAIRAPAYSYVGSNTSPNCEQGVAWIVFGTAQDMAKSIVDYMVAATKTTDDLGNYRVTPGTDGTAANKPVPAITVLAYLPSGSSRATYSIVTAAALFVAWFTL